MNVNFEVNTCTFDDGRVTSILYMYDYKDDNMELDEAVKLYEALGKAIERARAMEAYHKKYRKEVKHEEGTHTGAAD